ncbi:MAG: helix-turn-helix transcriptional regulator [Acidobacteriota bacterium]
MPFNSESLPTETREEFCLALKAARERKGISLAEIADVTKIPAGLFEALERNDLRRWPKGLFRRSFFRDYATAIGLPVMDACNAFVRLFCEDAPPADPEAAPMAEQPPMSGAPARDALMAAKRLAAAIASRLFASEDAAAPKPVDDPEARTWTSDARRVGPPERRLRVRIKMPH